MSINLTGIELTYTEAHAIAKVARAVSYMRTKIALTPEEKAAFASLCERIEQSTDFVNALMEASK